MLPRSEYHFTAPLEIGNLLTLNLINSQIKLQFVFGIWRKSYFVKHSNKIGFLMNIRNYLM